MKKFCLKGWFFLGVSLGLLPWFSYAASYTDSDLLLRRSDASHLIGIPATLVKFGGYRVAECRFAISDDGKYFYFTKLNSRCLRMTNSRGKKIVCTPDRSICKTRDELIRFVLNGTDNRSRTAETAVVMGLNGTSDGFLAVRSEPGGRLLGKLYDGDKIRVLAQRGKWYRIRRISDGLSGWSYYKWIHRNSTTYVSGAPSWCYTGSLGAAERTVCENSELVSLEKKLSDLYYRYKNEKEREEQRAWIQRRNSCGNNVSCIRNSYTVRIDELNDRYSINIKNSEMTLLPKEHNIPISKRKEIKHQDELNNCINSIRIMESSLEKLKKSDFDTYEKCISLEDKVNGKIDLSEDEQNSIAWDILKKEIDYFNNLPKSYRENSQLILTILSFIDHENSGFNFSLSLVKKREYILNHLPKNLLKNKYFIHRLNLYRLMHPSLSRDKLFMLFSIKKNSIAFDYIDKQLKLDKEFISVLLKHKPDIFPKVDESLKSDQAFIKKIFQYIPDAVKYIRGNDNDLRSISLEAIRKKASVLCEINQKFREDREIINEAIKTDGFEGYKCAPLSLRSQKHFILNILKNTKKDKKNYRPSRCFLEFATQNLRNDKEVVMEAITHNPYELKYVSERLKDDYEVVLSAIEKKVYALKYSGRNLLKNKDFYLDILKYADEKKRSNGKYQYKYMFKYICRKYRRFLRKRDPEIEKFCRGTRR